MPANCCYQEAIELPFLKFQPQKMSLKLLTKLALEINNRKKDKPSSSPNQQDDRSFSNLTIASRKGLMRKFSLVIALAFHEEKLCHRTCFPCHLPSPYCIWPRTVFACCLLESKS